MTILGTIFFSICLSVLGSIIFYLYRLGASNERNKNKDKLLNKTKELNAKVIKHANDDMCNVRIRMSKYVRDR